MNTLSQTMSNGFSTCFRDFAGRIHSLAENLSETQFWANPYGYGNSFGHLVLHLTGNLNFYIGTQIAQTGYVRDRDREFTETEPDHASKEEVLRRLNEAVAMVIATLEAQTTDDWLKDYEAKGADYTTNRFGIFLRCTAHFHHHIGQMIYLAKEHSQAG